MCGEGVFAFHQKIFNNISNKYSMKKLFLITVAMLAIRSARATNYYVDAVNGSNTYSGLSTTQAFKAIPTAAALTNPGDTVFIMNGNYGSLTISRSGAANSQIVYTNYPGHSPKLISQETTYNVVTVSPGTAYITINGLEVIGWGVNLSLANDTIPAQAAIVCPPGATSTTNVTFIPKYNGSGINVGSGSAGAITHHIVVSNNKVHDCAAVGISNGYCDYITIEGNTVYNNSWYTPYGTSGISFGNSANYDNNTTTYRTIVRNNVCYNNRLYVLWRGSCTISDGNGIILDIPRPDYNGRALVANNIVYNNGGSGIHTLSTNHVDLFNNVAYYNAASPTNNGGSIYAYGADDVKFYNNIIVARPGKPVNKSPNATNITYDYNVYYGGSTVDFVGAHSLIQDPKFVSATTDPLTADFHLRQGSLAINTGDNTHTYQTDKDGNPRPFASVADIGAYETAYTGNQTDCNGTVTNKILGNGSGTGEPGAGGYYGPYDTRTGSANYKSRHAIIYPQALLAANTVPATTNITSLQFKRGVNVPGSSPAVVSTQTVPDNSIIKIYLRNEADTFFTSEALDWNTILPSSANPSVLVYAGEASPLAGNSGGWKTVALQAPFNYTGKNLGLYVEYLQKGNVSGGTDIGWVYDNGGSQPLYNIGLNANRLYGTKATGTTGTLSDNLTANNERRAVITVGYCTNLILPVTLLQFSGARAGQKVYLNWKVTNEMNNAGFEIQRSGDGSYFEPIDFISARAVNNSAAITDYSFTDVRPINGISYYRLVQKDKDGKLTYSRIIVISDKANQLSLVSVYPNPVSEKLAASITVTGTNTIAVISLQDVSGRMVNRFSQQLTTGLNTINMNISKLPGSVYLLKIALPSGEKLITKVIKN